MHWLQFTWVGALHGAGRRAAGFSIGDVEELIAARRFVGTQRRNCCGGGAQTFTEWRPDDICSSNYSPS